MAKEIECTKGKVALVDDDDYPLVSQFRWFSWVSSSGTWYARRTVTDGSGRGSASMHRTIMCPPDNLDVDHINGDGMDNRRENLRVCTTKQNCANTKLPLPKSGYRGVYYDADRRRWLAQVTINGRSKVVGRFKSPSQAAISRDLAAYELYGDFAVLNFPELAKMRSAA